MSLKSWKADLSLLTNIHIYIYIWENFCQKRKRINFDYQIICKNIKGWKGKLITPFLPKMIAILPLNSAPMAAPNVENEPNAENCLKYVDKKKLQKVEYICYIGISVTKILKTNT